ncbi:MAG: hypothetical protein U5K32_08180 [Bacteroidales bacterium]|nr:hypothetical protein [Bacteroidales bacterium]
MTGSEVEELILLKGKVEKLLGRYEEVKKELYAERSEKVRLASNLHDKGEEIEELNKEYNKLQLSGAIKGDEESARLARKRINYLVREIDKCIALLNNI